MKFFGRGEQLSKIEKIILVLDEYPYLRENLKGLDSILQSLLINIGIIQNLPLLFWVPTWIV